MIGAGLLEAAAWWASRLGNCTHNAGMSNASEMELTVLLNAATTRGKFTEPEITDFQLALERVLAEHVSACDGSRDRCDPDTLVLRLRDIDGLAQQRVLTGRARHVIGCDYDPDDLLLEAGRRAGLNLDWRDLPAKTLMIITAGSVRVKEGYGAGFTEIWTEATS